jgi:hypothetical protein
MHIRNCCSSAIHPSAVYPDAAQQPITKNWISKEFPQNFILQEQETILCILFRVRRGRTHSKHSTDKSRKDFVHLCSAFGHVVWPEEVIELDW